MDPCSRSVNTVALKEHSSVVSVFLQTPRVMESLMKCLIRHLSTTEELNSNQNSFTVELLIGLAWDAEQAPYLYFLDLIKLHWELYVFIASFPTP